VSRVTSPGWGASIPERIKYLVWVLTEHPEQLEAFLSLAGVWHGRNPTRRFGAVMILSVMRWESGTGPHALDDAFRVNNNAAAHFARVFLKENPSAKAVFSTRKSWLDSLGASEQGQLDDALEQGRKRLEARTPQN
jgi:hypothetical protein